MVQKSEHTFLRSRKLAMMEDKSKEAVDISDNIESILRERDRLDQVLQERFKKEVVILFSDICGYTKYIDTRGDISGRAMLRRHNDIVLPQIEKHGGVLIKTIGDAVMVSFSSSLAAVKTAVAIQNGLHAYNSQAGSKDRIHVKIGINVGEALVEEADVYGDVVNVASRIQSVAKADQILISKVVYEQVRGRDDILCRLHESVQVSGKARRLELYRVVWGDEDRLADVAPKVRSHETMAEKKGRQPLRVFCLEVTREGDRLKISACEQMTGEASTIRHYEEIPVSIDWIESRCLEMVDILNNASRRGSVPREILVKLREVGQVFYDELFTHTIKEKIKNTTTQYLSLNLDERLVQVPWELLNDGQQFLCQRFNMGRLVRTRQNVPGIRNRVLASPLKMLILADPKGDLKGAYAEGTQVRDYMDRDKDLIDVSFHSGDITSDFIKGKIRNFDFVHFAGHADYNSENPGDSGWRLTKGTFKAGDITKMAGAAAMPALIFANACQSARTNEWSLKGHFQDEIFGLANAFLLTGVKHYVGTFWEILDEPSSYFALEFYKQIFLGMTTGEAIRNARFALIKQHGEENIVWASYLLYGDPTFNYMDQIKEVGEDDRHARVFQNDKPGMARISKAEAGVRAREEVIDFAGPEVSRKKRGWWAVAAGIILLAAVMLWGYPGLLRQGTQEYEKAALAYYTQGNFEEALNACNLIEEKSPDVRLPYLIAGNIYMRKGDLNAAAASYQNALAATNGTDSQKAEAFAGLGRIASLQKQPDAAMKYYQQATDAAPESSTGYLSRAFLLEGSGNYNQALELLGKAGKFAPNDQALAAITKETSRKVALAGDREKQEHIDKMVKDLLESMKTPARIPPSDNWTSPPLTLWLMDFATHGYSLQEGDDRLLAAAITDQIIQNGRLQVVERALLEKLLGELKLGVSKLADPGTALSLGRIIAARLIISGKIIYSGPQTQVSLRIIETETGKISAAVNESFGSAVPASVLADKLSKTLLEKIDALYPLRTRISEIGDSGIRLNAGQKAGVREGQQFKVIDKDVILKTVSVAPETSLSRIVAGKNTLQEGLRLEAINGE
jgi:class 3 adenylate cyclase/CHAT domain-containing protein/tetratricopeptide (TPR) repeat protein